MALTIEQERALAMAKARQRMAQQQPSIHKQEDQQTDYLKRLAEDQGPLQAGLISTGRGMVKLGRLVGLFDDETEIEKRAFEALQEEYPIASTVGEVVGESAPFLLPGLGQAPLAAKLGGGILARAGTAAGLGALEAGAIAAADGGDVGTSATVGAGVAAGLELAAPKIAKVFRKMSGRRAGQELVTSGGQLSPDFEKALAAEGITRGNIIDIAALPGIAEDAVSSGRGRLSQASAAKEAAKAVVIRQIKAGARDDALAPLMVKGSKLVDDDIAKKAINQGFAEGTVQLAKTANMTTKNDMKKALDLAFDISKQSRLAQNARPSDFAGKAFFDRVKHIKDTAKDATKELNEIAAEKLKGAKFNAAPIRAKINDIFEDLDITDLNPSGVPKPDFTGSQISGDKSSQRAIKELVRILSESKRTDALGAHMMKRQIDRLINYSKMPSRGLGEAGEKALKSVRSSFNDTLRSYSQDYARVNDVLSQSLDALNDLQSAVGKSVDLSMDGADRALGTSIRGLFSNRQKRLELDNAFNQIDDVAANLGGNFDSSYKDISQFTREIEDVFGKTAKTSFGGEVEGAIKSAASQGIESTMLEKGISKASQVFAKKKDTFDAYKAMREILEREPK